MTRKDAIEAIKCNWPDSRYTILREALDMAVKALEDVTESPTVDAVPVVRCRECKHCDPETHHCDHHMGTVAPLRRTPDDFCSYGERKEGADNGC